MKNVQEQELSQGLSPFKSAARLPLPEDTVVLLLSCTTAKANPLVFVL